MLLWEKARADAKRVEEAFEQAMSFPRDMRMVADLIGLAVYVAPLAPETSGIIIKRDKYSNPEIYIDETEPLVRQRFTLAHELGHYFDRTGVKDEEYAFLDERGSGHYDLHEFYADEFAGNLLMPADEINRLQEQGMDSLAMAGYFGVSDAAMTKRLERLAKIRQIETEG